MECVTVRVHVTGMQLIVEQLQSAAMECATAAKLAPHAPRTAGRVMTSALVTLVRARAAPLRTPAAGPMTTSATVTVPARGTLRIVLLLYVATATARWARPAPTAPKTAAPARTTVQATRAQIRAVPRPIRAPGPTTTSAIARAHVTGTPLIVPRPRFAVMASATMMKPAPAARTTVGSARTTVRATLDRAVAAQLTTHAAGPATACATVKALALGTQSTVPRLYAETTTARPVRPARHAPWIVVSAEPVTVASPGPASAAMTARLSRVCVHRTTTAAPPSGTTHVSWRWKPLAAARVHPNPPAAMESKR